MISVVVTRVYNEVHIILNYRKELNSKYNTFLKSFLAIDLVLVKCMSLSMEAEIFLLYQKRITSLKEIKCR